MIRATALTWPPCLFGKYCLLNCKKPWRFESDAGKIALQDERAMNTRQKNDRQFRISGKHLAETRNLQPCVVCVPSPRLFFPRSFPALFARDAQDAPRLRPAAMLRATRVARIFQSPDGYDGRIAAGQRHFDAIRVSVPGRTSALRE
jgi:hypothetical protein